MNKKTAVQPLSENTRKAIIIAAIVVVAVIILSVALALILKPAAKLPDDDSSSSNGSSSLTIRNGDFAYTSSDSTAFPKSAQNWTRYGYKEKSSNSDVHDFASISTHEQAVMGIVDTADWATVQSNLSDEGLGTITNPGTAELEGEEKPEETNVYMIATKESTAASILSDSFSVSSGTSVKITVRINTHQLREGTSAVIMVQKSTVSALSTYWYAYEFNELTATENNEWQTVTFHIFNRETNTQYVRISIGVGNVYSGETDANDNLIANEDGSAITGEGVLFIDDIMYEKVTADDYRQVVDADDAENSTHFKILENEDIVDESQFSELVGGNGVSFEEFSSSEGYLADTEYSPFTERDDFSKDGFGIYKVENKTTKGTLELRLKDVLTMKASSVYKDHLHVSFWVRVSQINKVAKANVHVQTKDDAGEWKDLTSGNWLDITTSQDIDTDNNAGWVKYDIYLKPASGDKEISILITFGDEKEDNLIPKGSIYVTKPAYETISYKDYNNASGGSYVKKFDLTGNSAVVTVTNGSFSSLDNTGLQPTNWTPVFAGDNAIYNDGKGNVVSADLDRSAKAVSNSGVETQFEFGPTVSGGHVDDEQKNVLNVTVANTSFGYVSSNFTLSARTAYVISVLARTNSPFVYLLNTDTTKERADRLIASVEGEQNVDTDTANFLGETITDDLGNGWVRYYIIVVTGIESQTVRLALFNGSLDGETLGSGTIYYDQVEIKTLDSYTLANNNEDTDEESDEPQYYDVEWSGHKYTDDVNTFGKDFGELLEKLAEEENTLLAGISVVQPTEEEWKEITLIPDTEEEPPEEPTKPEPSEVDLGLLFSVISSVALIAALGVVLVIKLFKNKKATPRAA